LDELLAAVLVKAKRLNGVATVKRRRRRIQLCLYPVLLQPLPIVLGICALETLARWHLESHEVLGRWHVAIDV